MIENCHNPEKVKYFALREFIERIKLYDSTLEHMEETNQAFDQYMRDLSQCKIEEVLHYWLSQSYNELVNSNKIENHFVSREELLRKNVFEKLTNKKITHSQIDELHLFVQQDKNAKKEKYRTGPVKVSAIYDNGFEEIFWWGAEAEDVIKFMNDFLSVYYTNSISVLDSNPFLKSALIHLLFLRIHPYLDGNGRTSRMLQSIKLTETINRLYGTDFRLCPINLSESIYINKHTYVNIIDNIYFDVENDNTKYINKWFMVNIIF